MKRLLGITIALVAAAAPFAAASSASAATSTTPIDPVIVLIGPSISSECDAATLVVGALPVLEPSLSPALTAVLPFLGPVTSICGTVPYNPSPSVCAFDQPMQAAIASALVAAGVPIPIRFHPIGGAVDQVGVIESKAGGPLDVGLANALGATLTCTRLASGPTDEPATVTPPAASGDTSSDVVVGAPSDLTGLGSIGPLGDLGGLGDLASPVGQGGSSNPAPTITSPVSTTRRIHVSYPIAWFIPLVLLFGVVALGHLFTRDMRDVP